MTGKIPFKYDTEAPSGGIRRANLCSQNRALPYDKAFLNPPSGGLFVNQSSATAIAKTLFEKHFFSVVEWLTGNLKLPSQFVRYPRYPGMSVVVNGQRVLEFNFLSQPLTGEPGNYASLAMATAEAACFVPYGSKGPMVTIDVDELLAEARGADVPADALLEILTLHEMVHAAMMGGIAQSHAKHPWVTAPEFRYIHEAVALRFSEFGLGGLLEHATAKDVQKYLAYIRVKAAERGAGIFYAPYFEAFQACSSGEFWSRLRASQPTPGIFEEVERLAAE